MASFRVADLIALKRDGHFLTREQIVHFVDRVVAKDLTESQIGAMLMAIYLRGMNSEETVHLTKAMIDSGESLQWPEDWKSCIGDKHSTGGVGDKISLPLAPALAACRAKVPMISGRGLGHTGGTLDKLESIPGYRVSLTPAAMHKILVDVGCCIVGQTESLAPADRVLYAVRDITGTVASVPLIASSIMSKKAAESLTALVLDVKCGRAAFAKTPDEANTLANALYNTCTGLGIKCTALITSMDHPIGMMVGNSLEVAESLKCLNGNGPEDLEEMVCLQGGHLLKSLNKVSSVQEGINKIKASLHDGTALQKFSDMLQAQGVSKMTADALCTPGADPFPTLPLAKEKTEVLAERSGLVKDIDALECATVCARLGAGRQKSTDSVDPGVGLVLNVHVGKYVQKGDKWVTVYHNGNLESDALESLKGSLVIQDCNVSQSLPVQSRLIKTIDEESAKKDDIFVCQ